MHLKEQEFLIVPKGTKHPKEANKEVSVIFFEPAKHSIHGINKMNLQNLYFQLFN